MSDVHPSRDLLRALAVIADRSIGNFPPGPGDWADLRNAAQAELARADAEPDAGAAEPSCATCGDVDCVAEPRDPRWACEEWVPKPAAPPPAPEQGECPEDRWPYEMPEGAQPSSVEEVLAACNTRWLSQSDYGRDEEGDWARHAALVVTLAAELNEWREGKLRNPPTHEPVGPEPDGKCPPDVASAIYNATGETERKEPQECPQYDPSQYWDCAIGVRKMFGNPAVRCPYGERKDLRAGCIINEFSTAIRVLAAENAGLRERVESLEREADGRLGQQVRLTDELRETRERAEKASARVAELETALATEKAVAEGEQRRTLAAMRLAADDPEMVEHFRARAAIAEEEKRELEAALAEANAAREAAEAKMRGAVILRPLSAGGCTCWGAWLRDWVETLPAHIPGVPDGKFWLTRLVEDIEAGLSGDAGWWVSAEKVRKIGWVHGSCSCDTCVNVRKAFEAIGIPPEALEPKSKEYER